MSRNLCDFGLAEDVFRTQKVQPIKIYKLEFIGNKLLFKRNWIKWNQSTIKEETTGNTYEW